MADPLTEVDYRLRLARCLIECGDAHAAVDECRDVQAAVDECRDAVRRVDALGLADRATQQLSAGGAASGARSAWAELGDLFADMDRQPQALDCYRHAAGTYTPPGCRCR